MKQRELKDLPAGVADDYTEKIKAMRNKESVQEIRQVKHIQKAMIEFIQSLQEDMKKKH